MVGGGSVREFLTTIVGLLPEPKCVKGFYRDEDDSYLAYTAGVISHEVLKAFCSWRDCPALRVATPEILAAGVPLAEYCETLLPLLPTVTRIDVGTAVDTIDWCATLPERIVVVDVIACKSIKDFTPLLAMKGLREVHYSESTDPSLESVINQLKNKGVEVL
ncbi:hypothetical protein AGDE_16547 [Angomonas deanei]|uniref:Leucine Rich repeat n=1 Tax=Angomonas deanei TaxID=59799 RepID=A0A7G2C8U6_9TRYP|nr:hypothetical protein AGDE_16547 [Angomonas deanei]CAD2216158.1 hypothetical protein, conserved [Angomonas deanei]|eukprot:EPY16905.1 hypothetical protein AGDE_16547 [Angomonas deanei]